MAMTKAQRLERAAERARERRAAAAAERNASRAAVVDADRIAPAADAPAADAPAADAPIGDIVGALNEAELLMLERNAALQDAIDARIEVAVGGMRRTLALYSRQLATRVEARIGVRLADVAINTKTGVLYARQ